VDATAQVAAAGYLQAQGFRQKQIAQARQIVLEGVPVEGDLMRDVVALLETGRLEADGPNVFRLPSAEVAGIAKAVHAYAFALATARAGRNVTRPLPGYLHKRQWEQDGKQMFSCFVSALGYYIPEVQQFALNMRGSCKLTIIRAAGMTLMSGSCLNSWRGS